MRKAGNVLNVIMDLVEVYVPCIAFMVVFGTYIVMIAYRYIFRAQLNWIYELSMISFIWTVMLPASQGGRTNQHIVFSIVYDLFSERTRRWFRIVGNLVVVVTFAVLLPHAWEAVAFLARKKSSIMKIPFNYIYLPFVLFVVLTIVHYTVRVLRDILPGVAACADKESA